ncbi:MAG: M12 family metallo-peptidase [Saprospiraceae bacterium]
MLLYKVDILNDGYTLTTSDGLKFGKRHDCAFFNGIISGKPTSLATLSITSGDIHIALSFDGRHFEIGRHDENYIGHYVDTDLHEKNITCHSDDLPELPRIKPNRNNDSRSTDDCVGIYFEIDFAKYNAHGGSITNTENWLLTTFNNVVILYANENIPINISSTYIWTSIDPFAVHSDILNCLNAFGDSTQNNFTGAFAHLVSSRNLGGGVAWLDVFCIGYLPMYHAGPYSVSGNHSTGTSSFPTYYQNVLLIAHELGHNFGSPHTHACFWNGNDTAIDGCYTVEGTCAQPGFPSGGGTIMSYCHIQSVGINFSKGFGPQPSALINDKYHDASCPTCFNCNTDTNTWTGPTSGGNWFTSSNWSLNQVPKACHNIIIPTGNNIIISQNTAITVLSLTIQSGSTLTVQSNARLFIISGGKLENLGTLIISGLISINQKSISNISSIENHGQITINTSGTCHLSDYGLYGLHNFPSGIVAMNGTLTISSNHPTSGSWAIQ